MFNLCLKLGAFSVVFLVLSLKNGFCQDTKRVDDDFSDFNEQLLPSVGAEFIFSDDVGAQYDRSFEKYYESSTFSWDHPALKGMISIDASLPGQSEIGVPIKKAQTLESLSKAQWMDIGTDTGFAFEVDENDRHLQYQLTFISKNGDQYPEVDKVEISVSLE
ncbi:MAG: hypothetical protein WDZ72_06885 [Cyclobacteriaceae bacterium]